MGQWDGRQSVGAEGKGRWGGSSTRQSPQKGFQKLPYRLPHTVHCGLGAPQGAVQGAVQGTSREGTIGCSREPVSYTHLTLPTKA